jgi:hypothetical protein
MVDGVVGETGILAGDIKTRLLTSADLHVAQIWRETERFDFKDAFTWQLFGGRHHIIWRETRFKE